MAFASLRAFHPIADFDFVARRCAAHEPFATYKDIVRKCDHCQGLSPTMKTLAEDPWLRQVGNPTSSSHGELPLGCWLVTPRRGYLHHGVYAGKGLVVHYAGLSRSWRRGPVEVVSLSEFSLGENLWVRWTPAAPHAGPPAVRRALSRLGEDAYRILTNNCEHFCAWCVEGDSRSLQVERWLTWPRSFVRATVTRIAQLFAPIG